MGHPCKAAVMSLGRKGCAAVIPNQLELQLQAFGVVRSADKAGVGIA